MFANPSFAQWIEEMILWEWQEKRDDLYDNHTEILRWIIDIAKNHQQRIWDVFCEHDREYKQDLSRLDVRYRHILSSTHIRLQSTLHRYEQLSLK